MYIPSKTLGRNLSNNAPTATVNLITPGSLYGDRVNELDLRLAKNIRIGRVRTNVGVDLYNVFNSAAVLTYNQTFVPATATSAGSWRALTSVLQARFVKASAQTGFQAGRAGRAGRSGKAGRMMRVWFAAVLIAVPGLAFAADGAISTWVSGAGPSAKTFVLKARGTALSGAVCGPCDDPSTVFRIEGTASDDTHASLAILGGDGRTPSTITLTRVDGDGTLVAAVKSVAAPRTPRLDGRWIAPGRVAQQNFTLKLRDGSTVWGVICGPCDKPAGVFLLDDGVLEGDAISFFIHHTDRRNFMKGVMTGNVMKFKWVREGRESEPGGEMTLIGPIR